MANGDGKYTVYGWSIQIFDALTSNHHKHMSHVFNVYLCFWPTYATRLLTDDGWMDGLTSFNVLL